MFSSHDVDAGTKLLLRTLADERPDKVLDLGCGYGALGLGLKSAHSPMELHMVDRDALAVHYAKANAKLNSLGAVETYGSLGYDDVSDRDFDLIVMNVPGKAGAEAIEHLLLDGGWFLREGGRIAVVVVTPLARVVDEVLDRTDVDVELRRSAGSYTCFHFRYIERGEPQTSNGFQRGIYTRDRIGFTLGELEYEIEVAQNLPEFDTLSFSTVLAADLLGDAEGGATHSIFQDVVVSNPGQGHIPIYLALVGSPERIHLLDRDLLSLRTSQANLVRSGFRSDRIEFSHSVDLSGLRPASRLVVDRLRLKEPVAAMYRRLDQISTVVETGAELVIDGSSTAVTRALTHLSSLGRWKAESRLKKKGLSAARLRKVR